MIQQPIRLLCYSSLTPSSSAPLASIQSSTSFSSFLLADLIKRLAADLSEYRRCLLGCLLLYLALALRCASLVLYSSIKTLPYFLLDKIFIHDTIRPGGRVTALPGHVLYKKRDTNLITKSRIWRAFKV